MPPRRGAVFDVDDKAFLAGLEARRRDIHIKTEGRLLRVAQEATQKAQARMPVRTGRSRDSVHYEVGRDTRGYYVDFGSDWFVVRFIEYGTSRNPARPVLRPALAEALGIF